MGLRGIPELLDQGMPLERLVDDSALNPFSSPVNQAHLAEAGGMCGADVLLDDGPGVGRKESVKIQGPVNRDAVGAIKSQIPNPKSQKTTARIWPSPPF